jgi:Glyoxalase-like domain
MERLRSMGIDDVEDDPTVLVLPTSGQGARLWFQLVPESKRVKNRVHVDLRTDDVDGELDRLLSLGATASEHQPNPALIVLNDPEGNEFCLLR